jgi:hypothetical protein
LMEHMQRVFLLKLKVPHAVTFMWSFGVLLTCLHLIFCHFRMILENSLMDVSLEKIVQLQSPFKWDIAHLDSLLAGLSEHGRFLWKKFL